MKRVKLLLLASVVMIQLSAARYGIVPYPQQLIEQKGCFRWNEETRIIYSQFNLDEITNAATIFQKQLEKSTGFKTTLTHQNNGANLLVIKRNSSIQDSEAYHLTVETNKISIEASNPKGVFYALQTLRQLFPVSFESKTRQQNISWDIPCCKISDTPSLKYRGFMLDVARSFSSVDEIKSLIDQLAFLKINTFHWHLTDDQGWRIEIKKYPKLTSVGAFRNKTLIGHYNSNPQLYDQTRTGGFYTQEDVKDIVQYASNHFVEVIPEIEIPGHAIAALAAYPQLSCTGGPFDVAEKWGIFNDIFCTKDETFQFIEDVLSEIIPLFKSNYIHIGGDEAPHIRWHNCYQCRERMKELNLNSEMDLQVYFIKRVQDFIHSKGKKIIGWDEILSNQLERDATIMSWQGDQGGIRAARLGFNVIMTPSTNLYFDYYQSQAATEPLAIGGYLPLEKVYSYNPKSDSLTQEQKNKIVGVQANLWTEYLNTNSKRQYMIFPRLAALSEIAWLPAEKKNYDRFCDVLPQLFERYRLQKINFSNAFFYITASTKIDNGKAWLQLHTKSRGTIHYTTDGSLPNSNSPVANSPVLLGKAFTLKAAVFDGKIDANNFYEEHFIDNLLAGEKTEVTTQPAPKYMGEGAQTLTDCIVGRYPIVGSQWLGYDGGSTDINVTFQHPKAISELILSTCNQIGQWIYAPSVVELYIKKANSDFELCGKATYNEIASNNSQAIAKFPKTEVVAVKAVVKNFGKIPQGNQGEGHDAWLFIDEFIAR